MIESSLKAVGGTAKVSNINDMPRKMAEAFFADAPTFLAEESTEIDWLIPGMIPRGNIILLSGEPSGGKSFIAYDLARAAMTATPWMGRGPAATEKTPVVFLNYDNPTETMRTRFKALGFTPDMPFAVHTLGFAKGMLPLPEQASRVKYALEHYRPGLVVFDSFRQGQTLDENSSKDMAQIMGILKQWTQINRTTVVALHHTNKGGGSPKQEWKSSARGSGEIIASAGVVCEIEPGKISWTKTQAWKIEGVRSATFEIGDKFTNEELDENDVDDKTQIIRLIKHITVKATSVLPGELEAESVRKIVDTMRKRKMTFATQKEIEALVPTMKANTLEGALRRARLAKLLEYVRTPDGEKVFRLVPKKPKIAATATVSP